MNKPTYEVDQGYAMKGKGGKRFFSFVLAAITLSLVIATFFPQELADRYFYGALWFGLLWLVLSIGLVVNVFNFLKRRRFVFALIYLGFILIIPAGFISAKWAQEGFAEIKKGQPVNRFYKDDDHFFPLDFMVTLKDLSVEYYPREKEGLRLVKKYKAKVNLTKDSQLLKEGIIEVNKPLAYQGFSFYQYGYDERMPDLTLLQVVKDPGLGFVYSGYVILLLGLLTSFKKLWKIQF